MSISYLCLFVPCRPADTHLRHRPSLPRTHDSAPSPSPSPFSLSLSLSLSAGLGSHCRVEFGRSRTRYGSSRGGKKGLVCGVGQERLGPSCFFISLVLVPLNSLLWYVPSSRYTWSSAPILFLQEQIKEDIIIYRPTGRPRRTSLPLECHRNASNRTRSVSSALHSTSR